jgi:HEAT repeat protein
MLVRVLESSRPLAADHQVALDALEALGLLRDGRAVPAVTAVMRTGTWLRRRRLRTLRRSAVRALVAIGDRGAGQALDEAASEGDRMLRRLVRDIRAREVPA